MSEWRYKDSGISWIGKIPEHWEITRVKDEFSIKRGRVIPATELVDNGLYPVYSSQTENDGCMGYINTYDFNQKCLTWTTDGVNAGTVFLRKGKFNCTNICGILIPNNSNVYLPFHYYSLFQIAKHNKRLDTNGAKIMSNEMAVIKYPIPPLHEQHAIADYLDTKTAAIDKRIEVLEKKQAVYSRLRKSIINRAVTRGLTPNVPLKDSGVDWIGMIPEHWVITEIKSYCLAIFAGATPSTKESSYWDGEIPWIPSGSCHDSLITEYKHTITEEGFNNSSTKLIPAKTTVMAMTGATCANTGYLTFASCANQSVCAYVENTTKCYSKFLFYMLQAARSYILTFQTGGAQAGINVQDCSNLKVPYTPLPEQRAIADYLDEKCAKIDAAVENIGKQIDALKRLKRALINEVVTGKRKV